MRCAAALAGATLASAACALLNGASSSATVGIAAFEKAKCCAIPDFPDFQYDSIESAVRQPSVVLQKSDGQRIASLDEWPSRFDDPEPSRAPPTGVPPANASDEGASDSPTIVAAAGPDPVGGDSASIDNSPDSVSSMAAAQASTWTKLLLGFADLRARVSGGR